MNQQNFFWPEASPKLVAGQLGRRHLAQHVAAVETHMRGLRAAETAASAAALIAATEAAKLAYALETGFVFRGKAEKAKPRPRPEPVVAAELVGPATAAIVCTAALGILLSAIGAAGFAALVCVVLAVLIEVPTAVAFWAALAVGLVVFGTGCWVRGWRTGRDNQ